MKDEIVKSEIENEVLFKPTAEDLSYQEPEKPIKKEGVFVESVNGLVEEKISADQLEQKKEVLQAEVLFKSGIEEIEVEEEAPLQEFSLEEEKLVFNEPVKPEFMQEEVLFASSEDEDINYSIFDNAVLPSGAENELLSSNEVSIASDLQFDIGDINVITTEETIVKPKVIKKNFAQKLLEADEVIKANYCELKNILLSYKKMKSRISNTADTFNIGRTKLAKLSVSGKSLKLYLNLDFNEVESRLKCRDASETKAYEEVPVFLRIRSLRAMKNAKYLIGKLAERFELQVNPKFTPIDAMAEIEDEV